MFSKLDESNAFESIVLKLGNSIVLPEDKPAF